MDKTLRVLIIEDSEVDRRLIERQIKKSGYEVVAQRVDNQTDLELALSDMEWDVIISDYSMPSFSGSAALAIVKESGLDLPFIMVSGVMGEDTAVSAMRDGAHDYLMKDNLNRLVPAIERELREAADRQARRHAEEQVRAFSRALSQSASLVMLVNIDGTIRFVNRKFSEITGYLAEEAIGQPWRILIAESLISEQTESLEKAMTTQAEWRGELQIEKKSGETFWVQLTLSPVREDRTDVIEFLFVAEDITKRKNLEAEIKHYNEQLEQMVEDRTRQLRQAKEETEVILNTTSDAIALALPTGDIRKTNRAFRELFGERVNSTIEQLLWVISNDRGIESVAKTLLSVIFDDNSQRVEAHIDANQSIDADLMFAPVANSNEDRSGLVMSLRDISHQKEFERFKSRFVANATHDLANPLAAIRVRLYILQKTPERLTEHVNHLEHQIDRLDYLISELRTLSEMDRGTATLRLEPFDLNALVNEIIVAQKPIAEAKNQILDVLLDETIDSIEADRRKIDRVITNLTSNAINYTPSGGRITIQTIANADNISISINDTGIGIDSEDMPHVFERFFRSERAQEEDTAGTGLGLAIAKEVIELHGGTIHVTSQVDIGTQFVISLPNK